MKNEAVNVMASVNGCQKAEIDFDRQRRWRLEGARAEVHPPFFFFGQSTQVVGLDEIFFIGSSENMPSWQVQPAISDDSAFNRFEAMIDQSFCSYTHDP
jgi:hypothetical protein